MIKIVIFNKEYNICNFIFAFIIVVFSNNIVNAKYDYFQVPFFAIKKYVGIEDSLENPTIFTTMNINGQGMIVQVPRGNTHLVRLISMPLPYVLSDNELISLSFNDANNDGMIDMIANLKNEHLVYLNHGDRFELTTFEENLMLSKMAISSQTISTHNYK